MQAKAIGIDFGGTTIKSAVVQGEHILQRGPIIDTLRHEHSSTLIAELLGVIAALRAEHPEVAGVGVGLPGFINSVTGVVHTLTNVPGWQEVALVRLLNAETGLPAAIENDANAMAYGEYRHGAAKGFENVICITLGTGVGGGLILDGRVYRGARFAAGEVGHTSIDFKGTPGVYQTPGDLETYVGNKQIAARAVERFAAAGRPRTEETCTPADLAQIAEAGDAVALALWKDLGTEIGAALVNAIWLLNPDAIVIGGGIAKAGPLIFDPIRATIEARTSPLFHEQLAIRPALLGNDAGIIGAAELALNTATR